MRKPMRSLMSDDSWRRHANPWSVVTRLAAIPAGILAVWSRVWIGGWAGAATGLVVIWLVLNVRVFAPVDVPRHWMSRAILGERLWLAGAAMRPLFRALNAGLILAGLAAFTLTAWGLWRLEAWAAVTGGSMLVSAQIGRLWLFARSHDEVAAPAERR